MARLVKELEAAEFMDANTEVGYMDNEFMLMWWKEASHRDRRAYRVWAVKDSNKVLLYFFNDGMHVTNVSRLKKGHERAIREQNELQQAGGQLHWPTGYAVMCDGIYFYLTEYRRAMGRYPSEAMWQQAWRRTVDSGGRVLTATFPCSRCRLRRRVNVAHLMEVLQMQRKKKDTCDALAGARCGVLDDRVWTLNQQVVGLARFPPHYADKKIKEEEVPMEEDGPETLSDHGGVTLGFSQEAKQFYKAQGKHLQMPCYKGESSEVDLFAWKRGIEKYFETYGIVVEREKVTMAADTLEGEAAKWWNGYGCLTEMEE